MDKTTFRTKTLLSLGIALGLFGLGYVLISSRKPPEAPLIQKLEGYAQGTTYHMSYVGPLDAELGPAVENSLAQFDKIFSNYRPDSDISRFNTSTSLDWFPVDPSLVQLMQRSQQISAQSFGLFDVSLGALIKAWGFGAYKRAEPRVPTASEIQLALKQSGFQHYHTQESPPALKKDIPELLIDLSGIAQGYAVDQVAKLFEQRGHKAYFIEIGGETLAKGEKAPGQDWTLAIETPEVEPGAFAQWVHPHGKAVATSGDYRNYFEKDGKRYTHILDPRSGRPIDHPLASVSVIADDCTSADAFAKAYMILGPEAAAKFAETMKMPILMLIKQASGNFEQRSAAGFDSYLMQAEKP